MMPAELAASLHAVACHWCFWIPALYLYLQPGEEVLPLSVPPPACSKSPVRELALHAPYFTSTVSSFGIGDGSGGGDGGSPGETQMCDCSILNLKAASLLPPHGCLSNLLSMGYL